MIRASTTCDLYAFTRTCDLYAFTRTCDFYAFTRTCDLYAFTRTCDLYEFTRTVSLDYRWKKTNEFKNDSYFTEQTNFPKDSDKNDPSFY